MNKRKFTVLIISFLIIFILFVFSTCSASSTEAELPDSSPLTEEKIISLREEKNYLIYDGGFDGESEDVSLENFREFILETDTFVYGEVVEDPYFVGVDLESGFTSVDNDDKKPQMRIHTIKVISDTEGIYDKGDVITFFYGLMGQYDCPSPKKGERILIPVFDAYLTSPADVKSSYYGYYYVTESGNVISAFEEDEDAAYSGQTVKNLLEILKKTDAEREEYLAEKTGIYERTDGKYGFTSIEMLREQIKEKLEAKKNTEK
ncbi:MAG: hypothetical protein E7564_01925 [Ruminococcaceae bacterium]|nr:hypothetical protein [Oscillospiraceae bacterium]